jgi:hypothetical protein
VANLKQAYEFGVKPFSLLAYSFSFRNRSKETMQLNDNARSIAADYGTTFIPVFANNLAEIGRCCFRGIF